MSEPPCYNEGDSGRNGHVCWRGLRNYTSIHAMKRLSHERGVESCRFLRLALQNYRTTKTTPFVNRLPLPLQAVHAVMIPDFCSRRNSFHTAFLFQTGFLLTNVVRYYTKLYDFLDWSIADTI
jgi:hypothetical protein